MAVIEGTELKCATLSPGLPSEVLSDQALTSLLQEAEEPGEDSNQESAGEDSIPAADMAKSISTGQAGGGSLVQEEEKDRGVVKLQVYRTYWVAVGRCLAPAVLLALFLMQGTCNSFSKEQAACCVLMPHQLKAKKK